MSSALERLAARLGLGGDFYVDVVRRLVADGTLRPDARVLVVHDSDYLYDDHVGEGHEDTTVTAELKLRRDVRDFLVRAHAERWP